MFFNKTMELGIKQLKKELQKKANSKKAKIISRFFKTGKGQYGEGDIFLGISVPETRSVAEKFVNLNFDDIKKLLDNEIHELRLTALFILINKYKQNHEKRKDVFDFYINNLKQVNNWDLVDLSAPNIIGDFLFNKPRAMLHKLAKSDNLWEKRISIIATLSFIKKNQFRDTFKISRILLNDKHDLIHKAVGWMLREIGKRNQEVEEWFLKKHYKKMPRTMLRYAIEKFDEVKRRKFLNGRIK